jgi:hypothetical protein
VSVLRNTHFLGSPEGTEKLSPHSGVWFSPVFPPLCCFSVTLYRRFGVTTFFYTLTCKECPSRWKKRLAFVGHAVLIRIETRAGHGAGKPTTKLIEEAADKWTFLVKVLGIKPGPASP